MATIRVYLCCVGLGLLTACGSVDKKEIAEVPVPAVTPFDSNQLERQIYLDSYKDGYRSAKHGGEFTPQYRRGPFPLARELGWQAGAAAAMNEDSGGTTKKYP
jgi:hypothetical protein